MQELQKVSLVDNLELRKQISEEIIAVLNRVLPPEKQYTKKEMDDFFNNQKHIEHFSKIKELNKQDLIKTNISIEINKNNGNKQFTPSYARYKYVFMDDSNTEEAKEWNNKYVGIMTDSDKSIDLADKIGKYLFNTDFRKYMTGNFDEALDLYIENHEFIQVAHENSRLFKEQHGEIHPDLVKLYNHNTTYFESVVGPLFSMKVMSNPLSALLPYKKFSNEDMENLMMGSASIINVLNKYIDQVEEFGSREKISKFTMTYPVDLINSNITLEKGKKSKELADYGIITSDFQKTRTFVRKGLPITYNEAIERMINGENIQVVNYAQKEKTKFEKALNSTIGFHTADMNQKYDNLFETIKQFSTDLENTKGFFTRDSKEFKDLTKSLAKLTKDYKNALKDINKNTDTTDKEKAKYLLLGKLYTRNQDTINNIKSMSKDYLDYKKNQESEGKVFNERSKNRISIMTELNNVIEDVNPKRCFLKNANNLSEEKNFKKAIIVEVKEDTNIGVSKSVNKELDKNLNKEIQIDALKK